MDRLSQPAPPWTAIDAAEEKRIVAALDLRLQCLRNPFVDGVASAVVMLPDELAAIRVSTPSDPAFDAEIERRIVEAVNESNAEYLRLDIRYVEPYGERRYVRLKDGATITGVTGAESTRKIVLVLPLGLADDSGEAIVEPMGEMVVFDAAGKSRPVIPGELLLFPAFMTPRFELPGPSLDAVVLYAHGPAFR